MARQIASWKAKIECDAALVQLEVFERKARGAKHLLNSRRCQKTGIPARRAKDAAPLGLAHRPNGFSRANDDIPDILVFGFGSRHV